MIFRSAVPVPGGVLNIKRLLGAPTLCDLWVPIDYQLIPTEELESWNNKSVVVSEGETWRTGP